MSEHSFVAFDDKFFYIFGIAGICELFFAEATEPAKLPNLILPFSDLQLFVKLYFRIGYTVERIVNAEKSVGHFVDYYRNKPVKGKLKSRANDNCNNYEMPDACAEYDIDSGDQKHCR